MKLPRPGRHVKRWLVTLLVLPVLWLLESWAVAHRLTHRSRRPFPEPAPAVAWAAFESARLRTDDGHDIGAWYAPGPMGSDAAAVILIHGNKGSRGNCLGRAELLAKAGHPVLLISLRAHGDSSGEFNDMGFSARKDVVAAVDFLQRRCAGRPIAVLGTSLGAAASLFAARELGHRVGGYILESPYQNLRVAVRNRTENELPPILDAIAYNGLLAVAPLVLPHLDRISPHDAIADVPADVPVLLIAGGDDLHARRAEAEALFDRVRSHGELLMFEGAAHLRMHRTDPARYRRAVFDFLGRIRVPVPAMATPADGPARRVE